MSLVGQHECRPAEYQTYRRRRVVRHRPVCLACCLERLHQTLKRYLDAQQPAETLKELQGQLDTFLHYYNNVRPQRALDGRPPLQACSARVKAKPTAASKKSGWGEPTRDARSSCSSPTRTSA
jgi:transposase InsO family protein